MMHWCRPHASSPSPTRQNRQPSFSDKPGEQTDIMAPLEGMSVGDSRWPSSHRNEKAVATTLYKSQPTQPDLVKCVVSTAEA